jgi:cobaltochelatase CobS
MATIPTSTGGSSLKGLYDSDVIASIVENKQKEQEPVTPSKLTSFKRYKFEQGTNTVPFSTMFWKPKEIPDIPVPNFNRSDWHEEAQLHIPDTDPNWVWNKPATERLALALYSGDTTLLHGLQGTGKSCLAEQWCAKFSIPFWRMSCNRETREAHFLGSPGVTYNDEGQMEIKLEPTILTDSLKYGGLFCEDEAFRHNSALVLQSLREKNTRTVFLPDAPGRTASERKLVAPTGKWWYVLTDNTCGSGDETGAFDAEVQDASTLDRIGAAIEIKYLGKVQERSILTKHSTLNKDQINGILEFAKQVRTSFEQQSLLATMSVRSLLAWAEKAEMTKSLELALRLSWYDKLTEDDKAVAKEMYYQVFARKLIGTNKDE